MLPTTQPDETERSRQPIGAVEHLDGSFDVSNSFDSPGLAKTSVHRSQFGRPHPAHCAEKDTAKQVGAKWDPGERAWYVPEHLDVALLDRWREGGAAPSMTSPLWPPAWCRRTEPFKPRAPRSTWATHRPSFENTKAAGSGSQLKSLKSCFGATISIDCGPCETRAFREWTAELARWVGSVGRSKARADAKNGHRQMRRNT